MVENFSYTVDPIAPELRDFYNVPLKKEAGGRMQNAEGI